MLIPGGENDTIYLVGLVTINECVWVQVVVASGDGGLAPAAEGPKWIQCGRPGGILTVGECG